MWCGGAREERGQCSRPRREPATGLPLTGVAPTGADCYAAGMARGWESKAIEAQQADAARSAPMSPPLSEAERERRSQAELLRLALAEATAQLQAACKPVHRDMLRQRIAALEARLAEVTGRGAPRGD